MKTTTLTSPSGVVRALALAVAALLFAPVHAASINYGDFEDYLGGGVVEYLDVTESSSTDPVPLFGAPEVVVNDLIFDPLSFGSSAIGGALDITDGQLNADFHTLPGTGLTSLLIEEMGDFTLTGAGTALTSVQYGLYVAVTVEEIDGVSVAPFDIIASTTFSEDLIASPGLNQPWDLGLLLEFGPALVLEGYSSTSVVTAGSLVLNNTLVTISEPGTLAFIAKKDFTITPGGPLDPDNIIPEPSAMLLVLLGTASFSATAQRRR